MQILKKKKKLALGGWKLAKALSRCRIIIKPVTLVKNAV